MPLVSLPSLETAVRQKADMEYATQFLPSAEVVANINQSIRDLYDLIVEHGDHSWVTQTETTLNASSDGSYSITGTPYKLVGMWFIEGSERIPVKPGNPNELFRLRAASFNSRSCKYLVSAGAFAASQAMRVETFPPAPTGTPALFRIIQEPPVLSGSASAYFPNGWDEYVVTDAAIKCLEKEESDTSALRARREMLRERIVGASATLDRGFPRSVTDVAGTGVWWEDFDE